MDISSKFKTVKKAGEESMIDEMRFNPNTVGTPVGRILSEGNELKKALGVSAVIVAMREKTEKKGDTPLIDAMADKAKDMTEYYNEETKRI